MSFQTIFLENEFYAGFCFLTTARFSRQNATYVQGLCKSIYVLNIYIYIYMSVFMCTYVHFFSASNSTLYWCYLCYQV